MNEYIQGRLFDDHLVKLDPRSVSVGGSWQGGNFNGIQHAWDMEMIKLIHSYMFEGCHLVDVGASTGSFALLPAVVPGAHLSAFEPNPLVVSVLDRNLILNGLGPRAWIYPVALHTTDSTASLKIPTVQNQSGLACIGSPLRYTDWSEIEIATSALDNVKLRQKMDVLKIDTEGCELYVLTGGKQTIRREKPVILCEYNPTNCRQFGYKHTEIKDLLESWGAETHPRGTEDLLALWPGEDCDK